MRVLPGALLRNLVERPEHMPPAPALAGVDAAPRGGGELLWRVLPAMS